MNRHKICVVTGTRAEYGLLKRIIRIIEGDEALELKLMVSGTHLSEEYGNTQDEIAEDGFEYDSVRIPVINATGTEMAAAIGTAIKEYAYYFAEKRPEIVVLLGDRYEIFAAAVAAFTEGIAIAHIAGGDVTEGALDDGFRNAITNLSTLHFPGCEESAKRIINMGVNPDYVFPVGSTGVENCLNTAFMNLLEISHSLGCELKEKGYAVVTYHPVTREPGEALKQVKELAKAMTECDEIGYIITLANADSEGDVINRYWREESGRHDSWLVVPSLGAGRYLSTVKYAAAVVGNSSSGVIEVPALKTPTVNIGNRQKGRPMAESVICCEPKSEEISKAVRKAVSKDFQAVAKSVKSPYGEGDTSAEIVRIIKEYLEKKAVDN